MKRLLLLIVVVCAMVLPEQLVAQVNSKKVVLYIDEFKGLSRDFGVGRYDYMFLVRDAISSPKSIRVPQGMKATLFDRDNFEGSSLELTDDANMAYLSAKGFGQTEHTISLIIEEFPPSAMPVAGTFVTIYKDDFSGASKNLLPGQYESYELGNVGNDQLSSIKIPKGMKVTLYEHGGFTGQKLVLTQDTRAGTLVANKFNDFTSSILVEAKPDPVPVVVVQTKPVVTPTAPVAPSVVVEPVVEPTLPTIYQSDFSGTSKSFDVGAYGSDQLGIGNDELSSIKVPYGFRVTLYENGGFEGRKLVITQNQRATFFAESQFNNVTSSILVERIPMVTIYQGDYSGPSATLGVGRYNVSALGTMMDVSSARVPVGLRLILFENENFLGRSIVLTRDTGTDLMTSYQFNNKTYSFIVEQIEDEVKVKPIEKKSVIIYEDNFSGESKRLAPGRYDYQQLGIRDNALSSITIPPGFRVQLFDHAGFEDRLMTLRADTDVDFFLTNLVNDKATALIVEEIPITEVTITVYTDRFQGASQELLPGRYRAIDLKVGNNSISSIRVPKGMRVTIHDREDKTGFSRTIVTDSDLTGQRFDNNISSLIVEDLDARLVDEEVKKVEPIPTEKPAPTPEVGLPVAPSDPIPAVVTTPPCQITSDQFQRALQAVNAKPFRDEKMETAKLATKDKCLSNAQIRAMAGSFSFEDQTLDFVKYAYDLSTEKSEYYLLEDIFKFMSSREDFMSFLKSK
jgi:hypothetical protein